jgi:hypothetical protein
MRHLLARRFRRPAANVSSEVSKSIVYGCNRVGGDCTAVINSVDPRPDLQNPFGHFSGTISGSVWSGIKQVDCGVYTNASIAIDGTSYPITVTGAW